MRPTGLFEKPNSSHSHPARFALLWTLLVVVSGAAFGQTSIVAVRNSREISIGADSMRTVTASNENGSVKFQSRRLACKIYRARNVYFGCSGACAQTEAPKIVAEGLGGSELFDAKLPTVLPLVQEALNNFLKGQRADNRIAYVRGYLNGKPVLSLLFIGILNGIPSGTAVDFLNEPSDGDIKTRFKADSMRGQDIVLAIGHNNALRALSSRERGAIGRLKPSDAVNLLVGLEIENESDEVGPPIDILQVTKTGACWVKHKQEGDGCETDIPDCATTQTPKARIRPTRRRPR